MIPTHHYISVGPVGAIRIDMIPAAAVEARWICIEPRRTLSAPIARRIVDTALPGRRVLDIQPLTEGLRNANFKPRLDGSPESIVLRIYEQDASLCQKELGLLRVVGGSVPVPEVLYAKPRGWEDLPPFILMRFVDGISFRDLKRSGDTNAIAQAAYSAGETLAAIGRVTFPTAGWLTAGPAVTAPLLEGTDSLPRFVDQCLESANLQRRMPLVLRDRARALLWRQAPQLGCLHDEARLRHGDFSRRNVLVGPAAGRWSVTAVLDWEFAISGSPLGDLDTFLRYERAACPWQSRISQPAICMRAVNCLRTGCGSCDYSVSRRCVRA